MSRNEPPSDPRPRPADPDFPEENPLIAFRRFADQQIASLLQGLVGVPSAWPTWTESERRYREESAADLERRLDQMMGRGEPRGAPEEGASPRSASSTAPPAFVPSPPTSFTGSVSLRDYLFRSPYSPLALEADPRLSRQRDWRAAFEELVATQSGGTSADTAPKEIIPAEQWAQEMARTWGQRMHESWGGGAGRAFDIFGSPLHGGLAHRHDPLGLPWLESREPRAPHASQDGPARAGSRTEPDTELDMYERFLDGVRPGGTRSTPSRDASAVAETDATRVVSTLTTTEHVVLPDGTTHTKVALRKTFGDGREESRETVHTGSSAGGDGAVRQIEDPTAPAGGEGEGAKRPGSKKGWFWS